MKLIKEKYTVTLSQKEFNVAHMALELGKQQLSNQNIYSEEEEVLDTILKTMKEEQDETN